MTTVTERAPGSLEWIRVLGADSGRRQRVTGRRQTDLMTLAYMTGLITTAPWQRSTLTTASKAGEVAWSNSFLCPSSTHRPTVVQSLEASSDPEKTDVGLQLIATNRRRR